jgi:hypothetical protein
MNGQVAGQAGAGRRSRSEPGEKMMRWIVLGALTLLTACGSQFEPSGPNYVRPDAAGLDLNRMSLTVPPACASASPGECAAPEAAAR